MRCLSAIYRSHPSKLYRLLTLSLVALVVSLTSANAIENGPGGGVGTGTPAPHATPIDVPSDDPECPEGELLCGFACCKRGQSCENAAESRCGGYCDSLEVGCPGGGCCPIGANCPGSGGNANAPSFFETSTNSCESPNSRCPSDKKDCTMPGQEPLCCEPNDVCGVSPGIGAACSSPGPDECYQGQHQCGAGNVAICCDADQLCGVKVVAPNIQPVCLPSNTDPTPEPECLESDANCYLCTVDQPGPNDPVVECQLGQVCYPTTNGESALCGPKRPLQCDNEETPCFPVDPGESGACCGAGEVCDQGRSGKGASCKRSGPRPKTYEHTN